MRTLRAIVKERLRVLDQTQEWLGAQVGMDDKGISAVVTGARRPPLEDAERWAKALGLEGAEADELANAMALEVSPQRVVDLVAAQQREITELRGKLRLYRDRVGAVRYLLDHIDNPPPWPELKPQTAAEVDAEAGPPTEAEIRRRRERGLPPRE